jgi:hypothetical protein
MAFNQRYFRKDKPNVLNVRTVFSENTHFLKGEKDEQDNFTRIGFGIVYGCGGCESRLHLR